ncbi:MAG: hypothetical protein IAG13_21000 [Deltaproteobacteria bacterium]|nr:hypothetical protein [Nannocystaceae bacterium]
MPAAVERNRSFTSPRLGDLGLNLIEHLWTALDFDSQDVAAAQRWFEVLAQEWKDVEIAEGPRWPSDITDDHTPFELSVAVDDGQPEARMLAEVGPPRGERLADWLRESWRRGRALNQRLEAEGTIDLGRLRAVEDLFEPGPDCERFAMWHALCFRRGQAPSFKIYLNPSARGEAPWTVIDAAMTRLGLEWARPALPRTSALDEPVYFSLDLSASAAARTKIYIAHPAASAESIERAVAHATDHSPGLARSFCRRLAGSSGPYRARPVLTCIECVAPDRRTTATVHFPVRSYAADDAEVFERVLAEVPSASGHLLRSALRSVSRRDPTARAGMQTYVSKRLIAGRDRYTVYLAPEAYST